MRGLHDLPDRDGVDAAAIEQSRVRTVVLAQESKAASLTAFAEELDFPTWFGGNLDALADCLDMIARELHEEWELVWSDVHRLRANDIDAVAGIGAVLRELDEAHPGVQTILIERAHPESE